MIGISSGSNDASLLFGGLSLGCFRYWCRLHGKSRERLYLSAQYSLKQLGLIRQRTPVYSYVKHLVEE